MWGAQGKGSCVALGGAFAALEALVAAAYCVDTASDSGCAHADLMYTQVKALKEGKSVDKPIYNHVTGKLDAPETIQSPKMLVRNGVGGRVTPVAPAGDQAAPAGPDSLGPRETRPAGADAAALGTHRRGCGPRDSYHAALGACAVAFGAVWAALPLGVVCQAPRHPPRAFTDPHCPATQILEGLHPFVDERVRNLYDFKIYLDISDDVKFAWKIQRDMAERGHSLESIKASIEARKPDFDAYVDPQKKLADVVIQVLPTQLVPASDADAAAGKVLRVRLIQKEGKQFFNPTYLFDEGSTISWIPCGRKLTCSYPGIKFFYGPDTYYGEEVSVLEMDGSFDKLEELIYVESHLSNTSAKFYGEVTQQMLKYADYPGSSNGTGLFQTLVGLKIRELYEQITQTAVAA